MIDIVYFVKDEDENEELKYSLRSLKNFLPSEEKRVIFYGGCPKDLKPDMHFKVWQHSGTKYGNVHSMYEELSQNLHINSEFYMFNDDFFVMKKINEWKPQHSGTLSSYIKRIEKNCGASCYTMRLLRALSKMQEDGKEVLNYELHIPMKYNKRNLRELLKVNRGLNGVRSQYGNIFYSTISTNRKDVKIFSNTEDFTKTSDYLSTSDESWKDFPVGEYIRNKFKTPSKYERNEE